MDDELMDVHPSDLSPDEIHNLTQVQVEHVIALGGLEPAAGAIRALAARLLLEIGARNEAEAQLARGAQ